MLLLIHNLTPTVTSTPSPNITPTPSSSSDSCPNNTNSFAISNFTNSISDYELKNLKLNSSFSTKSIDISRTIQFLNELKNVTNKKQLLEVIKKYKDVISELKTFRRLLQIINIIENIRDCAVIYDVMNQVTESLKNLQDARNKLESKDCYASNSDKSKYLNRISTKEYQIYDNLENFFKEMSIKFIPIIQLIEASQPYINNIKSFYQDSISFLNLMDKACEDDQPTKNNIVGQQVGEDDSFSTGKIGEVISKPIKQNIIAYSKFIQPFKLEELLTYYGGDQSIIEEYAEIHWYEYRREDSNGNPDGKSYVIVKVARDSKTMEYKWLGSKISG